MEKDTYQGSYLTLRRHLWGFEAKPTDTGVWFARTLVAADVADADRVQDDDAFCRMLDDDALREVVVEVKRLNVEFPVIRIGSETYESEARDPVAYWALGHPVRWRREDLGRESKSRPTSVTVCGEWRLGTFKLDGVEGGPWNGWTKGDTWNGFACPMFNEIVASRIDEAILAAGIEVSRQHYRIPTNEGVRDVYRYTTVMTWNEVVEKSADGAALAVHHDAVRCECGRWSGEPCAWEGPITETMVVDFMPRHLRESHRAAGNSGRYPENGAERIRVSEDCAARMIGADHEWVEVVSPGTEE